MKVVDPGSTQTISTHPLVRTHPETGRPARCMSAATCTAVRGMTEEESRPLIDFLM